MGMDGVELVMAWEEAFQLSITDGEAERLETPRHAINLLWQKLGRASPPPVCLSLRAFFALRTEFARSLGIEARSLRLQTRLKDLPLRERGLSLQSNLRERFGGFDLAKFGKSNLLWLLGQSPTMRDLVLYLVAHPSNWFRAEGGWSRNLVRQVVFATVREQTGTANFHEDSFFVRDLGLD